MISQTPDNSIRLAEADQTDAAARILVVDDEIINRMVLSQLLTQRGYEVAQAENGQTALQLLLSEPFDLVLLDLAMPGLNGIQTSRLLRQAHTQMELPVIIVTSSDDRQQLLNAFRNGANDYVTKPVDPEIVIARIQAQLRLKRAQEALRESEERYALAAQGSNDGLWDWNIHLGSVFFSSRWKCMLGLPDDHPVDTVSDWFQLIHPEDQVRVQKDLTCHLRGESQHFETELRMLHRTNGYRWMLCRGLAVRDERGKAIRIAGSLTDITEGKVADALTSLPNRLLFVDRVQRCLDQAQRNPERKFAILYMDVDGFKLINDTYGHTAGDEFLIEMAQRLETAVRNCDSVVARLGGDEFAVLVENLNAQPDAIRVAQRIIDSMAAPFQIAERELFSRASIGISINTPDCESAEQLIREADVAMYFAKANVHLTYKLFESEMIEATTARMEMSNALRKAVNNGEMSVCYQPIVDICTGRTAGFEALARWTSERFGSVPPDEFIPLAEGNGQIIEIGRYVINTACDTICTLNQGRETPLAMSVNISTRQIISPEFVSTVKECIEARDLPASCLKLEVTETTVMQDPDTAIGLLKALQDTGVAIGLDDFGTGYSSLACLHRLPLNVLKIDRSFVRDMFQSRENKAIIETIMKLAESLRLDVVAEGVENIEQLKHLESLGCRYVQGFYFCRPSAEEDLADLADRDWQLFQEQPFSAGP